jgi:hypothetical protein
MIIPDSVILALGWMAEQAQAGTLYQSLAILGVFVFIGIPVILCVVSWMLKSEPYGSNNQVSQSFKVRKAHRTATLSVEKENGLRIVRRAGDVPDTITVISEDDLDWFKSVGMSFKSKPKVQPDYDVDTNHCLKCGKGFMEKQPNGTKRCNHCSWDPTK